MTRLAQQNGPVCIYPLKADAFMVDYLVMFAAAILVAWTLFAFALAVPVGRLCAVRATAR
ncbi:MAG: hypothetical protein JWP02_1646 [Acidimicrobiales bacterium]|nr:hypothetical protein [Acidimicrobiales bacterium]